MIVDGNYVGTELALFQHAVNWKKYVAKHWKNYLSGTILEVGAGMGSNAVYLGEDCQYYTLLEPDPELFLTLDERSKEFSFSASAIQGTTEDLDTSQTFDTIIYYDVLEHIQDDHAEVQRIQKHLNPGGHLIILCPAFPYLFNEFDEAVGHYRRYTGKYMKEVLTSASSLHLKELYYLDSAGLIASLMNKWFLKQGQPSMKQVQFWDRFIVQISKVTDILTFKTMGKSVISIAQKSLS